MEREQVDMLLSKYRINKGRCGHLTMAIRTKEMQYNRLCSAYAADLIHGSHIGFAEWTNPATNEKENIWLPHGIGTTGDPTGSIAIKLASGVIPDEARGILAEIKKLQEELENVQAQCMFVDAWLDGLTDRESWIIRQQVIAGRYWREVVEDYCKAFGCDYSKESLKRVKENALAKIYTMAE